MRISVTVENRALGRVAVARVESADGTGPRAEAAYPPNDQVAMALALGELSRVLHYGAPTASDEVDTLQGLAVAALHEELKRTQAVLRDLAVERGVGADLIGSLFGSGGWIRVMLAKRDPALVSRQTAWHQRVVLDLGGMERATPASLLRFLEWCRLGRSRPPAYVRFGIGYQDECRSCGAPNCSAQWADDKRCCPDCSHMRLERAATTPGGST